MDNPDQADTDGDGKGDACDPTPDGNCEWTNVEYPIWGIAREGTAYDPFSWSEVPPDSIYSRDLERKVYELTDHLGNARVMLKDWKQSVGVTPGARPYEAVLGQYSNIYPFGMEQPGRSWSGGAPYRYGYNGMETSPETGGENYTTYFRQYDARIGRWMSTDPVTHEWESPYAAMGSNPIVLSDPSGADPPGGSTPLAPIATGAGAGVVWKSDESAIARNLEALLPKHRLLSMPKIDRAGGQTYIQSQGSQRSDGTTPTSWTKRKRSSEEMAYLRSLPRSNHPSGLESAPGVIRFGQGVVAGLIVGGLEFMNDPGGTTGRGIKNTAIALGTLYLASQGDGLARYRVISGVDNFLALPAEEIGFELGRGTVETAPLMLAGAVVIRASALGLSTRGAGLFAEGPAVRVTTATETAVATEATAATATKVGSNNNIALGVHEYLDDFAENVVKGSTWKTWGAEDFRIQFLETIDNPANIIHFNLDGITSPWSAISEGAKGFGVSRATSWELYELYSNPAALERTIFYQGGQVVPNPFR